jgi:DNA-3-methyladenine glycosylase
VEPDRAYPPLPREFFARDTALVARDLLGVWVFRATADGLTGGPIVETEAYGGPEDLASHARAGRTKRTAPMFGPVGHAYVYLVYGMHECLNVVAYAGRAAGAVLIRAIEPRVGVELMRGRRGGGRRTDALLAAGPARLCQALGVTRALDGHDLTAGHELWLAAGDAGTPDVEAGARIGVAYAGNGWITQKRQQAGAGLRDVADDPYDRVSLATRLRPQRVGRQIAEGLADQAVIRLKDVGDWRNGSGSTFEGGHESAA